MPEQWKRIPWLDAYEVSDLGNVRSCESLALIRHGLSSGYPRVTFPVPGGYRWCFVHVLVLEAFVGPRPAGLQCCHGNGDRTDNRLSNLRWDTREANERDKVSHGRHNRGERHGNAKLTAAEAAQIRAHRGFLSERHIADVFGVSRWTVIAIQKGRAWRSAA